MTMIEPRRINSFGVLETMADIILTRDVPDHIRSDNGAEMTTKIIRQGFGSVGVKTIYTEPGREFFENILETS
jgi:putative transposase